MPQFDFPLEVLESYRPEVNCPDDFDDFWQSTLVEARSFELNATFEPAKTLLTLVEVLDVTFAGYAGQPIKGWLILPKERNAPLPCVVQYLGYGGGRGYPLNWLSFAAAGYAHFVMDTRGQGSSWLKGDTPDLFEGSSPHHPGFMTLGILNPETYYYRRLFTDAVRAVEAAKSHDSVDTNRVAVLGGSQGGGMSLAVAGLTEVSAVLCDVPFLCHFERAILIADTMPYGEIVNFLKVQREHLDTVSRTLSYFDGVNFAKRASAPALFSVGLMDPICPPSTVYAAYNHYGGDKTIRIHPFNTHEGGQELQTVEQLEFLKELWG